LFLATASAFAQEPESVPESVGAIVEEQETPASEGVAEEQAAPPEADRGGRVLERPIEPETPVAPDFVIAEPSEEPFLYRVEPPLGFTGRSSVVPSVSPTSDFVPMEDRWRVGFPDWDRYDRGRPPVDDYPYELGQLIDPFNQNVLKGDYPIIGQNIFFTYTANMLSLTDGRQTPIGTTPFESTARPHQEEFFGSPNQLFYTHFLRTSFDLVHGNASFKQPDWRVKLTPVLNFNSLSVSELAFVNPNVQKGVNRNRSYLALEEYFIEAKLMDIGPDYDIVSMRVGSQFFNHDFRGFLFTDTNRAVRLFGSRNSNREQFNIAYFRQAEKDTNSALNTMDDRRQNILLANYFYEDFIFPGYTIQASILYNNDAPSRRFDTNSFRVRPDNAGVFQPHNLDVCYLGLASNGHIGRYNIMTQLYWAFGRDSMNPIANRGQDIRAGMAAAELSYDRDWARFRTSFFYSTGDSDPNNNHATGFDTVFDNPNFAGGGFSYWQRQGIGLFGVNLTQRESLIPNLKSSKIQGQSNFVNPGLVLVNFGMDFDLTPTAKLITNCNFLWFQRTRVLEVFTFDGNLANSIGTDISAGLEYRPLVNQNIAFTAGVSTLIPAEGFKALYNEKNSSVDPQVAAFLQTVLQY